MYLSHVVLEGGVFPHPPNAVYPTLTTAPFSLLLNASYPIPMAYYNNISDTGIHFTSSVPEGLEAYRFPCQVSTTENASDANGCSASSVPDELEAYPFPCQTSATENVSEADIYPTSVPGELEAYPSLCQMLATENISDTNICLTSFVPGELEAYTFPGQMSATEEVSFQADHTLIDPWSMAEQQSLLATSTTGYGTYHCHHSSRRSVSDARTSRASGFHLVRHAHR